MTDRITLTGLRVRGNHGVFDHERRDGQDFVVDVTVWLELAAAAATDDVTETLHYGELASRVAEIVGGEPRNLIETVGTEAAEDLMRGTTGPRGRGHRPQAERPDPADFDDVAVTIRSSRGPADMTRAVLSLGSNLGDRLSFLRLAVAGFADVLVAVSPVYETTPWGVEDQPDFLNAVLVVDDPAADEWAWLRRGQELEERQAGSATSGGARAPWTWTSSPSTA